MAKRGWFERWGLLAGPVFTVLFVVGFLIAGSSPDPNARSAKIAKYLASNSDYHKNQAGFVAILAAGLFLIVFYSALRARLGQAEGEQPRAGSLALGAGAVSTALLVVGILLFAAPSFAAHDAAKHGAILDPGIYRLSNDLGYGLWVASSVVGGLVAWSVWGVGRRTGAVPGWLGWFSLVAGILCLGSLFFFPMLLFDIWIFVAGLVLFLRRPQPAEAAAT
jgi:hypothetical protein